jgi:DNA-directed RNA polymerase subunit H (RpoH/RPB5)
MDTLFNKYENIQKFLLTYRGYTMKEKFYGYDTFKKTMQIDQYIKHICINPAKERDVYIYLFVKNSKYLKTTAQFKRLIDKIPDTPADVIIISKDELNVYINKALLKYPKLNIHNYLHKYFAIELTHGPLCSKHSILTDDEVRTLCSRDLIIHPLSLPSISINDPQNIWIGGELGQVIKIESISEITGNTIRYRIVSPDSGKLINMQKLRKAVPTNDKLIASVKDRRKKKDAEKKAKDAEMADDDEKDNEPENMEDYVDETEDEVEDEIEDDA